MLLNEAEKYELYREKQTHNTAVQQATSTTLINAVDT